VKELENLLVSKKKEAIQLNSYFIIEKAFPFGEAFFIFNTI
jgi:hypothetical protein